MASMKDKAYSAAEYAASAAKHFAFLSKCRLEILAEQEKIRRLYTKLGKVYYKDYVTDEEPDEAEYAPVCERISECFRRINELREDMAEAKAAYQTADEEEPVNEDEVIALPAAEEAE